MNLKGKGFAAEEKLEILLFASVSLRGGRKGGLGEIGPSLPDEKGKQAGTSFLNGETEC
ncbi:MAG: hypothetical protein NUV68_04020 [Caldiserica bacterium]|jgi:hypothetical protein|nr:hypothetical protein [Caldisericota bacterium]MDH7562290.1 hypothetical protein [Caldisericota bacterium]